MARRVSACVVVAAAAAAAAAPSSAASTSPHWHRDELLAMGGLYCPLDFNKSWYFDRGGMCSNSTYQRWHAQLASPEGTAIPSAILRSAGSSDFDGKVWLILGDSLARDQFVELACSLHRQATRPCRGNPQESAGPNASRGCDGGSTGEASHLLGRTSQLMQPAYGHQAGVDRFAARDRPRPQAHCLWRLDFQRHVTRSCDHSYDERQGP